jgi:hypothetical protein
MEFIGYLLRLQEPAVGPHPEADESSPHPPTQFPKDPFNITLPFMPRSSEWSPLFRLSS